MANSGRFYTTFTGFCFYGIPFIIASIAFAPVLAIVGIGTVVVRAWTQPTMV